MGVFFVSMGNRGVSFTRTLIWMSKRFLPVHHPQKSGFDPGHSSVFPARFSSGVFESTFFYYGFGDGFVVRLVDCYVGVGWVGGV